MKKITLIILTFLLGNLTFSQTIVPTTVTKKIAILEEFTGLRCVQCPDGHKRANELAKENPGKFYAISIHAGVFAVPTGGLEKDYRTPFGIDIDANADAKNIGYPSGSINRRKFSTDPNAILAKNRASWASHAATVMAEDSPVNIAINASLDPTNRQLTVLVELYYTDSAVAVNSMKENYLTVAVLQDNIVGAQIGKEKNPTAVKGNLYNHTHMLRTLLTKEWEGDVIKVRKGFISKTITHTIPTNYLGIPAKIEDLSVVAFIAKTKDEIFTGTKDSNLLPPSAFAGLTTTYANPKDKGWCANQNLELTVTNNGAFTITNFKAALTPQNSNTNIIQSFSGSLAPNQSTKLSFPLTTLHGLSSYSFLGKLYDVKANGNQTKFSKHFITGSALINVVHIPSTKVKSFPFSIDFEGDDKTVPSNVYRTSDLKHPYIYSSKTADLGGFGKSKKSLLFNFYSLTLNHEISMVLQKLDLSSFTTNKAGLRFAYAHALSQGNEPDKLSVQVSTDCGANWTSIWSEIGTELATAPPPAKTTSTITYAFFPTATQWKEVILPLNNYAKSDVLIRFKGIVGRGNLLYLDDIKISPQVLSTNELFSRKNSFTIFPNPASNQITLSLIQDEANKTENKAVAIKLFDITGRNVFKSNTTTEKLRNYKINTQGFAQGIYFVEVSSENQKKITKLVIQ